MADTVETAVYKLGYETGDSKTKVDALNASVGGLVATTEKSAESQEKVTRATRTTTDGMEKMLGRLDPLIRAQQQLQRTLEQINRLQDEGIGTTTQLARATELAEEKYRAFVAANDNAVSPLGRFSAALGVARNALALFGIGLGVSELVHFGSELFKSTADIENQSKTLGVSIGQLQAYRAGAVLSGAGADVGDAAIQRFTRSLGENNKAFLELGLSASDLAGGPGAALPKVAQGLLGITDVTTRARLEVELFGKSGQVIEQVLERWADPNIVSNMDRLGLTIDEQLVKRAAEADREWGIFWQHFKVAAAGIAFGGPIAGQKAVGNLLGAAPSVAGEALSFATPQTQAIAAASANAAQVNRDIIAYYQANAAAFKAIDEQRAAAVPSHELSDYVSKLQQAADVAAKTAKEREVENALIEAARAKQKDIVVALENARATQDKINAAKAVEVTTTAEAERILGRTTTDQVTRTIETTRLNAAMQEGAQRIEDIRALAGPRELQVLKSYEDQNKQLVSQATNIEQLRKLTAEQILPDQQNRRVDEFLQFYEDRARFAGMTREQAEEEYAVMEAQRRLGPLLTADVEDRLRASVRLSQQLEKVQAVYEDIDRSANRTLADFFATGKLDAGGFFESVRRGWAQLLADMTQEALLRPIEVQIVGSMQQGLSSIFQLLGLGGQGGASLSGVNGGPSLLGQLQTAGGIAGMAPSQAQQSGFTGGYGTIGKAINQPLYGVGGLFGGSGTPSDSTLGSALGGGLQGYGIGSLYGQIAGLSPAKAENASIGGAIGGIAGSFFGPIGSLVGSALGSFVGGLFGPGPSNFTASAKFNANQTTASFSGDKPNDNTVGLSKTVAQGILQELASLKSYGVGFTDTISQINIGERDRSTFLLGSGTKGTTSTVGDAGDLALQAIEALLKTANSASPALQNVLSKNSFASVDDLDAAVKFVTQVYDTTVAAKPAMTQVEQAMKDMTKAFFDAQGQIKSLGLDMDAFAAGTRKSFDQDIRLSIEQIQDPLKYALDLWQRDAQARLNAAATLGGDIDQVRTLNDLLRKQAVDQASSGTIASLKNLIDGVNFGPASAFAPDKQYFSVLSAYNQAKSAALTTGSIADIGAFQSAAQALLPIARGFLGTSERYGALTTDVVQTATQFQTGLTAPPAVDLHPVVEATAASATAIVSAIQDTNARLDTTNARLDQLGGVIGALARRVA